MKEYLTPGVGGLPKVILNAPDGGRAEVYLHGAHVTSWTPAGAEECLFLSQTSEFKGGAAIRGGVPVAFPQFSERGTLPKHGLVRTQTWELSRVETGAGFGRAVLRLQDNEFTRQAWPFPFLAEVTVTVGGASLQVELAVTNRGAATFHFTAALHTYFQVSDVEQIAIHGLDGLQFEDHAAGDVLKTQPPGALKIVDEVDRIYYQVPGTVELVDAQRRFLVSAAGFPDAVVWNPGPHKGAALSDLEPGGYRRMVCIEAAAIGHPVELPPGDRWQAAQSCRMEATG